MKKNNKYLDVINHFADDKYGVEDHLKERVFDYLNSYESIESKLESENLPCINGVWDYKANNLIFIENNQPVLIDPCAGNVPRILDLALAVLILMFIDEALWLICSDENGWKDKRQNKFLKNLIRFEDNEWLFEL